MRVIALATTLACAACVTTEADDGPTEDLGALGGKADGIMTRNLTLRPHLASGAPSRRTYTLVTADAFRVSLAYAADGDTRLVVSDDAGPVVESPAPTWQPTVLVPAAAAPRTLRVRIENTAATALPVRLHLATPDGRALRVATFNIRWYGLGGDVDAPKPEYRNPALRAFLADHLADADVIVFEEITDVAMLRSELAPAGWSCETYANTTPKHQFVVACHAPEFTLTREADDDDLAYQPLAMGTLRPAVTGILREASTGAPLARLVGLHLKALPDSTDKRLQQARLLVDRLGALATATNDQLPIVIAGDFNAHRAVDTHRDRDDWDLIGDVLASRPELGLVHVEHGFANTFRDKDQHAYKLDHLWLGSARASAVDVAGPCNLAWETDQAAIEQHFDAISDHCPVIATVTLP